MERQIEKPTGCCSDTILIDFTKMELPDWRIDLLDKNLWLTLVCISFNPIFWNLVVRRQYRTKFITKVIPNAKVAVVILGLTIVLLGILRDFMFKVMMDSQPKWPALYNNWILWSGYACMWIGTVLVFSSFYVLGFYGTFLGDYFGILMEDKVTGFPFNYFEDPMYVGSTLNFLGAAIIKASQSGILVSFYVGLVYSIALRFEGPFTAYIYSQRESDRKLA